MLPTRKNITLFSALLLLLISIYPASPLAASQEDQQYQDSLLIGKRIYNEGMLPSGKPVKALVQGDVKLSGELVSCVNCHQRSGMGSSESRQQILPINEQALFEQTEIGRSEANARHLQKHLKKSRPIYTDETLRKVIREGIDPDSRTLNPLMPKFILDNKNLDHLINYIKSLSAQYSPGVTDTTIHFATIITDEVDKEKQGAMLDMLSAFTRIKNADTRNETGRAKHSPFHKEPHYTAYRKWELHTWHLEGTPDTWENQLERLYKKQPVFALLSGISTKSWAPIHQFCNDNEIPCLFPSTDLPIINDDDFYTLYFSKGLYLEAETLAKYILQNKNINAGSIIQVYSDNEDEKSAANYFRQALKNKPEIIIKDVHIENDKLSVTNIEKLIAENNPASLVLWLKEPFLDELENTLTSSTSLNQVFLSSSLLGKQYQSIPQGLYDKILLTYPFDTPDPFKHVRMKAWSRLQHVNITNERIQADAFFTVKTVSDALMHIRTNLYRDYFIERIEHMIDSSLVTSVYPRLSLGPGQRFASKGCYIVKLSKDKKGLITPVSEWIIP